MNTQGIHLDLAGFQRGPTVPATSPGHRFIRDGIESLARQARLALQAVEQREFRRVLNRLDDRLLKDIGLLRSEIDRISRMPVNISHNPRDA